MKYCVYETNGNILRTGYAPEVAHGAIKAAEQGRVLFFEQDTQVSDMDHYVDVEKKSLVKIPARPSEFHVWSNDARVWEADFAKLILSKKKEIETERDRRIVANILYGNILLDANERAQSNISSKLSEIAQVMAGNGSIATEQLVWRDADNNTHHFPHLAAYRDWLGGLVIAISERATLSYQWSWDKKAALEEITDFDEAMEFTVL